MIRGFSPLHFIRMNGFFSNFYDHSVDNWGFVFLQIFIFFRIISFILFFFFGVEILLERYPVKILKLRKIFLFIYFNIILEVFILIFLINAIFVKQTVKLLSGSFITKEFFLFLLLSSFLTLCSILFIYLLICAYYSYCGYDKKGLILNNIYLFLKEKKFLKIGLKFIRGDLFFLRILWIAPFLLLGLWVCNRI